MYVSRREVGNESTPFTVDSECKDSSRVYIWGSGGWTVQSVCVVFSSMCEFHCVCGGVCH